MRHCGTCKCLDMAVCGEVKAKTTKSYLQDDKGGCNTTGKKYGTTVCAHGNKGKSQRRESKSFLLTALGIEHCKAENRRERPT